MKADRTAAPKLKRERLLQLLETEFPEATHAVGDYEIEEIWYGGCRVRRRHHERSLRPGGTVSGPVMMALADFTMYLAVLSAIGWVPLAVTTNLSINFLKRPGARDLLAEAQLFKLGKRLAVGEVALRSDGDDDLVAHITSTYSIPGG
ncbi:MAG: PaaI family thioesterase [Xanthobacteraceae bacterium]